MALEPHARRVWAVALKLLVAGMVALVVVAGIIVRMYPLKYREVIEAASVAESLSPYLVAAVIRCESGFKVDAVSPKGARGLMQVMPETGKWAAQAVGLKDYHPDALFEPSVNITVGTWYLAELKREFGGDLILALAAYNCGSGRVREWLNKGGLRLGDGPDSKIESIPVPETKEFVKKVLWYQEKYRMIYWPRTAHTGAQR